MTRGTRSKPVSGPIAGMRSEEIVAVCDDARIRILGQNGKYSGQGLVSSAGPIVFEMGSVPPIWNRCEIEIDSVRKQIEFNPFFMQSFQKTAIRRASDTAGI